MNPRVVLLGPQRYERTVGRVAKEFFPDGPIAIVTAGWQEWEVDDEALDKDLGGRSRNLELYRRAEAVFEEDGELRKAHRALQRRIRLLKRAYQLRMEFAYRAWQAVDRLEGDDRVLGTEREGAFQAIRALDERQVARVQELRDDYEREFQPSGRPAVKKHVAEIGQQLDGCAAVVIEGGHVPLILNRLRLFDLAERLRERVVVACAGAAMVLAPRIVFFHDAPPQGLSRPEVAEAGLGLFEGVVALPDASRRLALDDRDRVSRFARRFAPDSCVTLDGGKRIDWDGNGWTRLDAGYLTTDGNVEAWEVHP